MDAVYTFDSMTFGGYRTKNSHVNMADHIFVALVVVQPCGDPSSRSTAHVSRYPFGSRTRISWIDRTYAYSILTASVCAAIGKQ